MTNPSTLPDAELNVLFLKARGHTCEDTANTYSIFDREGRRNVVGRTRRGWFDTEALAWAAVDITSDMIFDALDKLSYEQRLRLFQRLTNGDMKADDFKRAVKIATIHQKEQQK